MPALAPMYAGDDTARSFPFMRGGSIPFLGIADNINDNYALLQTYIDALPASGGTIELPATPNSALVFSQFPVINKRNVRIVGQGGNTRNGADSATVIRYTGSGNFINFDTSGAGCQGFGLIGVGVHGNTNGKLFNGPVYPNGFPGGLLRDVRFYNSNVLTGWGVYLADGAGWDLDHVTCYQCGTGMEITTNTGACTIIAPALLNNRTAGLKVGTTLGLNVYGGNIEQSGLYDVDLDGCDNVDFWGVTFETSGGSIHRIGFTTVCNEIGYHGCHWQGNSGTGGSGPAINLIRVNGFTLGHGNKFMDYPAGFIITNTATAVSNVRIYAGASNLSAASIISALTGVAYIEYADGKQISRFAPTNNDYIQSDWGTPTSNVRANSTMYGSGFPGTEIPGVNRAALWLLQCLAGASAMLIHAVANVPIIFATNGSEGMRLDASNGLRMSRKFYPQTANGAGGIQAVSGLWMGTGAPNNANGADNHFYLQGDGGVGTTVWKKVAGVWVAIL